MIVPLVDGEYYQLYQWARARLNAKRPNARSRRFSYRKSDLQIHLEGVTGEYVVSKSLCLPYDPRPLPGGDKGQPDLVLPSGRTVQIKYREKKGWDFALNGVNPEDFKADLGVLVYPDDLGAEVVGWITREDFERGARIENYLGKPGGERLACGPDAFRQYEELLVEEFSGMGKN